MGNILTRKERLVIQRYIRGTAPGCLSAVIWDSINQVGVDDTKENLGIYFGSLDNSGESKVVFWDKTDSPVQISRKLFLLTLEFVAQEVAQQYKEHPVADAGTLRDMKRLYRAMKYLRIEIENTPDDLEENLIQKESDSITNYDIGIVAEIRIRRGTIISSNHDIEDTVSKSKKTKKSRPSSQSHGWFQPFNRVRHKLIAISHFSH